MVPIYRYYYQHCETGGNDGKIPTNDTLHSDLILNLATESSRLAEPHNNSRQDQDIKTWNIILISAS